MVIAIVKVVKLRVYLKTIFTMKMLVSIRKKEEYCYSAGYHFALPLTRIWFENASNDLHLQFTGHEDTNICPPDNSHDGEMIIPPKALIFRAWLKSLGLPSTGTLRFQSCSIESDESDKEQFPEPPADALDDLVANWVSPNRSSPLSIFADDDFASSFK